MWTDAASEAAPEGGRGEHRCRLLAAWLRAEPGGLDPEGQMWPRAIGKTCGVYRGQFGFAPISIAADPARDALQSNLCNQHRQQLVEQRVGDSDRDPRGSVVGLQAFLRERLHDFTVTFYLLFFKAWLFEQEVDVQILRRVRHRTI